MLEALKEFNEQKEKHAAADQTGIRQIARSWNVPYATFRKRILMKAATFRSAHMSGRPTILTPDDESELAHHIRNLAEVGFPCDRTDIRKLAFEYAIQKGVKGFTLAKKTQAITGLRLHEETPLLGFEESRKSLHCTSDGTKQAAC